MTTTTKQGKTPPEVKVEGEQEVKAFWSECHVWELIKPFFRFLLLIFLAAKNSAIGNDRIGIENESKRQTLCIKIMAVLLGMKAFT